MKTNETLKVNAVRVRPIAFHQSGIVVMTQDEDVSGDYVVINKHNLYCEKRGIYLHPDAQELRQLREGKPLRLSPRHFS